MYVYVIAEEGKMSPVKIGVSESCRARLDTLQPGNHRVLELVAVLPIKTRSFAYEVENRTHQFFSMFRIRGEWFDVDAETVMNWCRNLAGGRVRWLRGRRRPKRETPQTAKAVLSA